MEPVKIDNTLHAANLIFSPLSWMMRLRWSAIRFFKARL